MLGVVVAAAWWSKSPNLKIASGLVALDWLLSNLLTTWLGPAAVNWIAPMNILFAAAFWTLLRLKAFRGRIFYAPMALAYTAYVALNLWHLGGRVFYPETLTATYYFAYLTQNIIFILVTICLFTLSILKGISNRVDGGLLVFYDRLAPRIAKFRRDTWKGWMHEFTTDNPDIFRPIVFAWRYHILQQRPDLEKGGVDEIGGDGQTVAKQQGNKD